MRYTFQQFKDLVPALPYTPQELADELSAVGHETEVVGEELATTLTANRTDCKDIRYLAFDLAGARGIAKNEKLIDSYGHGKLIIVSPADLTKILGRAIGPPALATLTELGFKIEENGVRPPDFRRDIATKADVAEELIRKLGYDWPEKEMLSPQSSPDNPMTLFHQHLASIKITLSELNLTETHTNSFSSEGSVKVKNPFSQEEPYLRSSLLEGLLKTLARNPYLKQAGFFELGWIYPEKPGIYVGIILAGYKDINAWQEKISQAIGHEVVLEPVDPTVATSFDVKQGRLYWTQLEPGQLKPAAEPSTEAFGYPLPTFKPISKFPPLVRSVTLETEVTVIAGQNYSWSHFITTAWKAFPELLIMEPTGQYHDETTGKKTITYRLIFQKMESSFTETEINELDQRLAKHFFLEGEELR